MTAWRKLSQFEGRSSFRSWVSGIGFRIARDAKRSHDRTQVRDSDWVQEQSVSENTSPVEDRIAITRAMAGLPDEQRAVVALCFGEGFSHTEAAEILKLPLGTVKSHAARGRERLLRALEAE